MVIYSTLSVKGGEKKHALFKYNGKFTVEKKYKKKTFKLLLYNLFQKHVNNAGKKALDVIYTANSCRHVPSPIEKVNATMAVRNMQVKTQSGRNKAPHTTQISAALNNIPPVSMSNSLACFHYKTKVTFVCVSNVL